MNASKAHSYSQEISPPPSSSSCCRETVSLEALVLAGRCRVLQPADTFCLVLLTDYFILLSIVVHTFYSLSACQKWVPRFLSPSTSRRCGTVVLVVLLVLVLVRLSSALGSRTNNLANKNIPSWASGCY
jgi:hypothetical protein